MTTVAAMLAMDRIFDQDLVLVEDSGPAGDVTVELTDHVRTPEGARKFKTPIGGEIHRRSAAKLGKLLRQSPDAGIHQEISAVVAEVNTRFPGFAHFPGHIGWTVQVSRSGGVARADALTSSIDVGPSFTNDKAVLDLTRQWGGGRSIRGDAQASDPAQARRRILLAELGIAVFDVLARRSDGKDAAVDLTSEPILPSAAGYQPGDQVHTLEGKDLPLNSDQLRKRFQIDTLRKTPDGPDRSLYAIQGQQEFWSEAFLDGLLHGKDASPSGQRAVAIADHYLGPDAPPEPAWVDPTAPKVRSAEDQAKYDAEMAGIRLEITTAMMAGAQPGESKPVSYEGGLTFMENAGDTWKMDTDRKTEIATSVNEVRDRLPQLVKPEVFPMEHSFAIAQTDGTDPALLFISPDFMDDAAVQASAKSWEGMEVGSPPGGTTTAAFRHATLVHEMGHNAMTQMGSISKAVRIDIEGLINEMIDPNSVGFTQLPDDPRGPVPSSMSRWRVDALRTPQGVAQTAYGLTEAHEWWAEAFADGFLHGDQASASGQRALALAMKYLGGAADE